MSEYQAVREVLARYVRAADHRDGAAMAALFLPEAGVTIFWRGGGELVPLGRLEGAESIGAAVAGMMQPHPPLGWSHHTTHDHLIEVTGDAATMDAQFVVFDVRGTPRPAEGWPAGTLGAQGTIRPIESGYYQSVLARDDGRWRIARHRILLDLPMAFPEPA